uniref:Putative secreted protein n=1 Tax=Amblyomma cajennense TaxID=34607 RepID=A0A023FCY9_AMBCJ
MASWARMNWQAALFILLSAPCFFCVEGNQNPTEVLSHAGTLFLTAFSIDSVPQWDFICVNSTFSSESLNVIRRLVYSEEEIPGNREEWKPMQRTVTFRIQGGGDGLHTLNVMDVTPNTDWNYAGDYSVESPGNDCVIICKAGQNGENRCMVWGKRNTFAALSNDCQSKFLRKCPDGKKIEEKDVDYCS